MASSDGSIPIDPDKGAQDVETTSAERRGSTAAERRQDDATSSDDPEVLTAEIERTREDLAETFDEIADRVSPKRVAERTKQTVRHAVKESAEGAKETVRAGAAAVKSTALDAKQAVTGGSEPGGAAGGSVAVSPTELGGTAPTYPSSSGKQLSSVPAVPAGSASSLGAPAIAGAVAAVLVALLVLRRRRR